MNAVMGNLQWRLTIFCSFPDSEGLGLGIVWSPLLTHSDKTAEVILDSTDAAQLKERKRFSDPFMSGVLSIPSAASFVHYTARAFAKSSGQGSDSALL